MDKWFVFYTLNFEQKNICTKGSNFFNILTCKIVQNFSTKNLWNFAISSVPNDKMLPTCPFCRADIAKDAKEVQFKPTRILESEWKN
jgi:hypothetical protein